jgi:hypothetical protein
VAMAAAAIMGTGLLKGRQTPKKETKKAGRQRRERIHYRISKRAAIILVLVLLTTKQTLGGTTRQAGNNIDHNPTVVSRSAQQQMARLIGNGLQYSRAATRVASDGHCHEGPNSPEHPESHTTKYGTVKRRRVELLKGGDQISR